MSRRSVREYRVTMLLGPVAVALATDQPSVVDCLAEFYPMATAVDDQPDWVVDARVGPGDGMPRNRYGVALAANATKREVVVRADDPVNLAMTTRKAVREAMIGFVEQRRYTMLHASAVADERRVLVVVGDKGSGKTTLALRSALQHGLRYVANDHLILYPDPPEAANLAEWLVVTSLPTLIPVKVGTYLDLEHLLPAPWDTEGLDVDAYRGQPAAQRYPHDARVLYTYRRLGHDNPVTIPLGPPNLGPAVLVVLARYATNGQRPSALVPVADPVAALLAHVRFDWMFDPQLNERHLPRVERDRAAYAADAQRLVQALAARVQVVAWTHRGDPTPLLDALGHSGSRP